MEYLGNHGSTAVRTFEEVAAGGVHGPEAPKVHHRKKELVTNFLRQSLPTTAEQKKNKEGQT